MEDLVQETFARLWIHDLHALRSVRAADSVALAAWLRVVAAAVVQDWLRSERSLSRGGAQTVVELDGFIDTLPSAHDTFRAAERSLRRRRINHCLEAEKERDRSIFWLYYDQGLTAKNIAEIAPLGLSVKGVETTILRVTRAVRDCVGKGEMSRAATAAEGNRP